MKNLQKGFSLIELLVVVAIIGILAAIGSVGYSKYIASAQSTETTANVEQMASLIAAEDTQVATCTSGLSGYKCASNIVSGVTNNASVTCSPTSTADSYNAFVSGTTVTITGCPKANASAVTRTVTVNSSWSN
jgi:type IV pilus assembly protein PilA